MIGISKIKSGGIKIKKHKIILLGSSGALGKEIFKYFQTMDYEIINLNRKNCDFTDFDRLSEIINRFDFDFLINAAGWTDVDGAEAKKHEVFAINCTLPMILSEICEVKDAKLIHFSSDYIFEGKKIGTYGVEDSGNPLNIYGQSKMCSERVIKSKNNLDYWIIRTAWLYGSTEKDFVHKIKSKILLRENLQVVDDQIGHPTLITDVVRHLELMFRKNIPSGTYHVVNSGIVSRFDLANKIKEFVDPSNSIEIKAVRSVEKLGTARRPSRVELDLKYWEQNQFPGLRSWEEALKDGLGKEVID